MTPLAILIFAKGLTQETDISSYVQTDLQDVTLVAKIIKGDQSELKKINKDFGLSYQFKESTISIKLPLKMRAETKIEDSTILYVINGTDLMTSFAGLHSKQNLATKPGRRQSSVEIGILTPDLFTSFLDAKFVEKDNVTGAAVFDLTFKQSDIDKTRNRVWIDRSKKYIVRRNWFNQEGKQLATFMYTNPIEVNGVWLPTHLEVKNSEDKLAGVTDYTGIKVNSGLSDAMFVIK